MAIVLDCGGGPQGKYIGGSNWIHPGAFNYGFKGLCSTFVTAAFAFSGTELVCLAAAETANPRKSLPRAVKQVFWRISLVRFSPYFSDFCQLNDTSSTSYPSQWSVFWFLGMTHVYSMG